MCEPHPMQSTVPCCNCGGVVVEFSRPNSEWNAVVRQGGSSTSKEYLCTDCYMDRLYAGATEIIRDSIRPLRIEHGHLVDIANHDGASKVWSLLERANIFLGVTP